MQLKFSHVDVLVNSLSEATNYYATILGARISKSMEWNRHGFHVRYAVVLIGQERFILVEPIAGKLKALIDSKGEGTIYRHCYSTPDIGKAYDELIMAGIQPENENEEPLSRDALMTPSGASILWLPKRFGEFSIELIEECELNVFMEEAFSGSSINDCAIIHARESLLDQHILNRELLLNHDGKVVGVHASSTHTFSKQSVGAIQLVAGIGIQGDAHCGETVQHRSRVAKDPSQPNLRQVHLIQGELFKELTLKGYTVEPGDLGENITTEGIDLLALPENTELKIGAQVVLKLTGLRNPCWQIDHFRKGLMAEVIEKSNEGLKRKCGVMSVVLQGGTICAGDHIQVVLPALPHNCLKPV